MTFEAIWGHTDSIVAFVAELFPAGMAVFTHTNTDIASYAVADDFFTDGAQQFPMVIAHIFRVFDAFFILWIRHLQEGLLCAAVLSEDMRSNAVEQRNEDNKQNDDCGYSPGSVT